MWIEIPEDIPEEKILELVKRRRFEEEYEIKIAQIEDKVMNRVKQIEQHLKDQYWHTTTGKKGAEDFAIFYPVESMIVEIMELTRQKIDLEKQYNSK